LLTIKRKLLKGEGSGVDRRRRRRGSASFPHCTFSSSEARCSDRSQTVGQIA
jgi:hypothetical protein